MSQVFYPNVFCPQGCVDSTSGPTPSHKTISPILSPIRPGSIKIVPLRWQLWPHSTPSCSLFECVKWPESRLLVKARGAHGTTKALLSLSLIDRRTSDQQSPRNELGKHHSSRNLKKQLSAALSRRFQSAADVNPDVSSCQMHQRPSPAGHRLDTRKQLVWYSSGSPTVAKTKGLALVFHQSPRPPNWCPFVCGANIFWIPGDPASRPRTSCLLGWHPRQKSHHSHDMVAPRPLTPPGT